MVETLVSTLTGIPLLRLLLNICRFHRPWGIYLVNVFFVFFNKIQDGRIFFCFYVTCTGSLELMCVSMWLNLNKAYLSRCMFTWLLMLKTVRYIWFRKSALCCRWKPNHLSKIVYPTLFLLQYAHKLAYLVGQNIRKDPSPLLSDRLYFLWFTDELHVHFQCLE